jgi:hypothetical protein
MKRTIPIPLLMLCVIGATGCARAPNNNSASGSKPEAEEAAAPTVDPLPEIETESPDSVVRSYWALKDWGQRNTSSQLRIDIGEEGRKYIELRQALGGGEFLEREKQDWDQLRTAFKNDLVTIKYQRDILHVKTESETRAIVVTKIKNVTPIPDGVSLASYERERREYGRDVRYVVEKIKGQWRLTQAWYRDSAETEDNKEWQRTWTVKQKSPGPSSFNFYFIED